MLKEDETSNQSNQTGGDLAASARTIHGYNTSYTQPGEYLLQEEEKNPKLHYLCAVTAGRQAGKFFLIT